jgi:hypothetical protein
VDWITSTSTDYSAWLAFQARAFVLAGRAGSGMQDLPAEYRGGVRSSGAIPSACPEGCQTATRGVKR